MGLLDQVLGQVIGGMAGGSAGGGRAGPAGGLGGGGGLGGALGGMFGSGASGPGGGVLGGLLGGAAGKYSPLVMALLSLLASKQTGSATTGGGSMLNDILGRIGGGAPRPGGPDRELDPYGGPSGYEDPDSPYGRERSGYGEEPDASPYRDGRGRAGQGSGGGFLESVGSLLDGPGAAGPRRAAAVDGSHESGAGDGLGGLLERFRSNGRGDLMESWIGHGPNAPAAPDDLEQALGPDAVDELSRRTGLGRDDLLAQLSHALPQVVDGLTPAGRVPTADEQRSWV